MVGFDLDRAKHIKSIELKSSTFLDSFIEKEHDNFRNRPDHTKRRALMHLLMLD